MSNVAKLLLDFEETVDIARDYLRGLGNPELLCRDFAEGIVRIGGACVIGLSCARHGAVHGQEAEELRAGIEQILRNTSDVRPEDEKAVASAMRKSLIFLLDQIDARDSLAFREAADPRETATSCA